MNGGGSEVLHDEEVGEVVGLSLGLDEDQGETLVLGGEQVEQGGLLVHVVDVHDLLGDVLGGGTDSTDGQEYVVGEEVAGEVLDVVWEGGGEHEGLSLADLRHVTVLDDVSDLWLETHVQHSVGLIEDKVLDVAEGDLASLEQVVQTTWGGDKEVTASLHLSELETDWGTTVDNAGLDPGSVTELLGLVEDLGSKLSGWSHDDSGWVGLSLVGVAAVVWGWGGTVLEGLGEDWEEETTSLTGTGLGTGHEVSAGGDDGDGVLLDGGRLGEAGELDILEQKLI